MERINRGLEQSGFARHRPLPRIPKLEERRVIRKKSKRAVRRSERMDHTPQKHDSVPCLNRSCPNPSALFGRVVKKSAALRHYDETSRMLVHVKRKIHRTRSKLKQNERVITLGFENLAAAKDTASDARVVLEAGHEPDPVTPLHTREQIVGFHPTKRNPETFRTADKRLQFLDLRHAGREERRQ